MTFDEFKALALTPPHYDGGTIFRVDTYCYCKEWVDTEYELERKHRSFHLSLKEVEVALKDIKPKVEVDDMKVYCHFVFEIPTRIDVHFEKYISVRTYDADGKQEDQSVCTYGFSKTEKYDAFRGRAKELIKHHVGDFVEIVNPYLSADEERSAKVYTALLTSVPRSIEKCWEIYRKLPDGFFLDWMDDKYFYIDDPKHRMWNDDIHPVFVFKPREPISESRKNELIEFAKDESVVNSYWHENGSETDRIITRVAAIGNNYQPDGPQLEPDDFLPVYGAQEVFDSYVSVDCSTPDPLNALTYKLLEIRPDLFEYFDCFLINFINTDLKDKKLKISVRCKWWQELQRHFPKLGNFPNRKFGHRIHCGATEYRIEIIAYK